MSRRRKERSGRGTFFVALLFLVLAVAGLMPRAKQARADAAGNAYALQVDDFNGIPSLSGTASVQSTDILAADLVPFFPRSCFHVTISLDTQGVLSITEKRGATKFVMPLNSGGNLAQNAEYEFDCEVTSAGKYNFQINAGPVVVRKLEIVEYAVSQ